MLDMCNAETKLYQAIGVIRSPVLPVRPRLDGVYATEARWRLRRWGRVGVCPVGALLLAEQPRPTGPRLLSDAYSAASLLGISPYAVASITNGFNGTDMFADDVRPYYEMGQAFARWLSTQL